jgi:HPt (histidine-containing phosphotransfer) domain-containing protein
MTEVSRNHPISDPPTTIPNLPGFDLSLSLNRVGNNWALLQNILFIFFRTHQTTYEKFTSATQEGDWPTAIRLVHTVKGSSATIGAMHLADLAGEIEDHLKENQFDAAASLQPKFKSVLDETLSTIEKFKASQEKGVPDNKPAEPASKQELIDLTDTLIRNLTEDLSKAEEQIKKFSSITEHHFTSEHFCTELKLAFEHFNFPKVKSLLKEFRESLLTQTE